MKKDISFREVCNLLRTSSEDAFDSADKLASLILILSVIVLPPPVSVGAATLSLLADIFSLKAELGRLIRSPLETLLGHKEKTIQARYDKVRAAYGLICYTAFFEALEHSLPSIWRKLRLTPAQKTELANSALDRLAEGHTYLTATDRALESRVPQLETLSRALGQIPPLQKVDREMTSAKREKVEQSNRQRAEIIQARKEWINRQRAEIADAIVAYRTQVETKITISEEAAWVLEPHSQAEVSNQGENPLDRELPLPHPIDGISPQRAQLLPLYAEMVRGLSSFLSKLALWETTPASQQAEIQQVLSTLPEKAWICFLKEYSELAIEFDEFFRWATLQELGAMQALIREIPSRLQQRMDSLLPREGEVIDVGFKRLSRLETRLEDMPRRIRAELAETVVAQLEHRYTAELDEPILKPNWPSTDGQAILRYPKKCDIFIPQAYKVLRFTGQERVEAESLWDTLPAHDNLGEFLSGYFASPYSASTPLVILGQPGSGKSLLADMLVGSPAFLDYTRIRVQLRQTTSHSIARQIETQVDSIVNQGIRWGNLVDFCGERPPLIIFDAYDELLLVGGDVYSDLLQSIAAFQYNEAIAHHQPVRAVVTSRLALIGKSSMPEGSTVIQLQPFDQHRQEKWIKIWNDNNRSYFKATRNEPLALPDVEDDPRIAALAMQPLLLLMLALYDSEDNSLRRAREFNRTTLYTSLLRQFVQRQLVKDKPHHRWGDTEQDPEVDRELQRLGVAALAMFNRKTLVVKSSELSEDLKYLQLEKPIDAAAHPPLSQAGVLLSGFFFVRESKVSAILDDSPESDEDPAYEFLHATFGEFLTADFMVRTLMDAATRTDHIPDASDPSALRTEIESWQHMHSRWAACFAYAPLFSRPVIVDMLRELLEHRFKKDHERKADFLRTFDTIVTQHLRSLLTQNTLPPVMAESAGSPFRPLPLLGFGATYSLNLLLLRAIASDKYMFDEDAFPQWGGSTRPWDSLTYLWRSWFSEENLALLSTTFTSRRDANKIWISIHNPTDAPSTGGRLDSAIDTATALSDNLSAALAGLIAYNSFHENRMELEEITHRLKQTDVDLTPDTLTRKLQRLWAGRYSYREANQVLAEAISYIERADFARSRTLAKVRLLREYLYTTLTVISSEAAKSECMRLQELFVLAEDEPVALMLELAGILREYGTGTGVRMKVRRSQYLQREPGAKLSPNREAQMSLASVAEWLRIAIFSEDAHKLRPTYSDYRQLFYQTPVRNWHWEFTAEMAKLAWAYNDRLLLHHIADQLTFLSEDEVGDLPPICRYLMLHKPQLP